MATLQFTVKALDKLTSLQIQDTNSRPIYLWDTELSGFGCRITEKGKVSWLVQRWTGGRSGKATRQVIGKGELIGLDEARKLARKVLLDIDTGVDVVERKRETKRPKKIVVVMTTSQAIERFSDPSANHNSNRSERYIKDRKRELTTGLADSLTEDIRSVTKAVIREKLDQRPSQSTRRNLYAALSPLFNWLHENDHIEVNPIDTIKTIRPVASRDRVLTPIEIKALWSASYHMPDRWGSFYRLLLLTGQRREEVSGMHMCEVEGAVWTILAERTKNGKTHDVHLSSMALAELEGAQGYVFPAARVRLRSTGKSEAHISGYSKMKAKLDGYMKAELAKQEKSFVPWRVHDLRRTMASGMAELGVLPEVIERILNHTSGAAGGLKAVYQRYEYLKERKEALEAWSKYIRELVSPKPGLITSIGELGNIAERAEVPTELVEDQGSGSSKELPR